MPKSSSHENETKTPSTNLPDASAEGADHPASRLIDERIAELKDWRGDTLARIRALIHEADAQVEEDWKWRGVPVWSHAGIICTGETYKSVVKLTFAHGASLDDPLNLFNSSLEGNTRRAIDIHEGEEIEAQGFKELVMAAIQFNEKKAATKGKKQV